MQSPEITAHERVSQQYGDQVEGRIRRGTQHFEKSSYGIVFPKLAPVYELSRLFSNLRFARALFAFPPPVEGVPGEPLSRSRFRTFRVSGVLSFVPK